MRKPEIKVMQIMVLPSKRLFVRYSQVVVLWCVAAFWKIKYFRWFMSCSWFRTMTWAAIKCFGFFSDSSVYLNQLVDMGTQTTILRRIYFVFRDYRWFSNSIENDTWRWENYSEFIRDSLFVFVLQLEHCKLCTYVLCLFLTRMIYCRRRPIRQTNTQT